MALCDSSRIEDRCFFLWNDEKAWTVHNTGYSLEIKIYYTGLSRGTYSPSLYIILSVSSNTRPWTMAESRPFYLVSIFALFTFVSLLTLCAWMYLVMRKFPHKSAFLYCLAGRFLDFGLACVALAFVLDYPPTTGRLLLLVASLWFNAWVEVSSGADVFPERLTDGGYVDDPDMDCRLEVESLVLPFDDCHPD